MDAIILLIAMLYITFHLMTKLGFPKRLLKNLTKLVLLIIMISIPISIITSVGAKNGEQIGSAILIWLILAIPCYYYLHGQGKRKQNQGASNINSGEREPVLPPQDVEDEDNIIVGTDNE
jgi:hypothetical protein